jgi:O-antigen/teichoic acid export membrane protein
MREEFARLFRHSGVYLLGNILNRLGAFLLLPLYTSYLTVAEFGTLELLYSTVSIASVILSAGLAHTTIRFFFDKPEGAARDRIVVTNFLTVFLLGVLGATVMSLLRQPLAELIVGDAAFGRAVAICLAIMVMEMSAEIAYAYMRAREQSSLFVWMAFAKLVLQVAVSVYLVAGLKMGVEGVLWANLASVSIIWLFAVTHITRSCGTRVSLEALPAMLRYSLPMAATGLIAVVAANVDRFLIKEVLTLAEVGLFALAMKFALLLAFVVSEPFARAYGPFRFSVLHRPDAEQIQILVARALAAGCTFVALAIALAAPHVLAVMAAPSFRAAEVLIPGLLLAFTFSALTYCFETGILAAKKTARLVPVALLGLALKVALNLALLPWIGAHGAVLTLVICNLVHAVLINRLSNRLLPVAYPIGRLTLTVLLGVGAYALTLPMVSWPLAPVIIGKACVLAAYPVLIIGVDPALRAHVRTWWSRFRKRSFG